MEASISTASTPCRTPARAEHRACASNRTLQRPCDPRRLPSATNPSVLVKLRYGDGVAQHESSPVDEKSNTDKMLPVFHVLPVQLYSYVSLFRKITLMNVLCACTIGYISCIHWVLVPTQARLVLCRGRHKRLCTCCSFAVYDPGTLSYIQRGSSRTFCHLIFLDFPIAAPVIWSTEMAECLVW